MMTPSGGRDCIPAEVSGLSRPKLLAAPRRLRPFSSGPECNPALLWVLLHLLVSSLTARNLDVVIVRGADGEEEYGKKFTTQVEAWKAACTKGEVPVEVIAGPETTVKLEKRLSSS